MYAMFFNCKSLADLNVSGWITSNVTNMYGMFQDCLNLTALNLSSWRTSNVTKMHAMFYNCANLQEVDIRNFDLSSLDADYVLGMFENCNNLHTLRLDNCNNATISQIITSSGFPTTAISGVTRTIYCKESEAAGLTPPRNWVFSYV
jgi:surface protein